MFTDVNTTMNSFQAIEDLRNEGWVVGVGNNQFKPYDSITRAQMAVLIERAKHGPYFNPPAATGTIPDVSVDYWGAKWIEAAINDELMDLYPDERFYPRNPALRSDVAILVWLLR